MKGQCCSNALRKGPRTPRSWHSTQAGTEGMSCLDGRSGQTSHELSHLPVRTCSVLVCAASLGRAGDVLCQEGNGAMCPCSLLEPFH